MTSSLEHDTDLVRKRLNELLELQQRLAEVRAELADLTASQQHLRSSSYASAQRFGTSYAQVLTQLGRSVERAQARTDEVCDFVALASRAIAQSDTEVGVLLTRLGYRLDATTTSEVRRG